MKMLYSVLFVLCLAAMMTGNEAAVDCINILTCLSGIKEGDCSSMQKANKCFRGALDDCREKKIVPDAQIDNYETQMKELQDKVNKKCGAAALTVSIALLLFAFIVNYL